MATFLETGVLSYFSIIFPAILVFAIVYALLSKTKILGENRVLHATIAIFLAFMVMLSRDIAEIINFGAPWFVLVFVFMVLILLIYRFMGASEADLTNFIKTDRPIAWFIFAISIIIVISSISHIYGQRLLEQTDGENLTISEAQELAKEADGTTYRSELYKTFFSPKILGLIFIFLVATFTIAMLTRETI
jgi:hypothetical protein